MWADPESRDVGVGEADAPFRRTVVAAAAGGDQLVAVVCSGDGELKSTPIAALPPSPRQWVNQWTAASLDNPARVCQQLFAPALAAAFEADTGRC
jgi:hypothetical protein